MIVPDEISRSSRRTVSLTVMKNGAVVVKAPLRMTDAEIGHFVESKQNWIKTKLCAVTNTLSKYQDIINYEKVMVYGSKYTILLAATNKIEIDDENQLIFPKKTVPEKRLKALKTWYKKFAKRILENRISMLADKYKFKFSTFKITDSKGRWGSCNSRGVICINFRVIMLPPAIIDYILVHELCHLTEMNHSRRFWEHVMAIYPATKAARAGLKEYGFLLDLYKKS